MQRKVRPNTGDEDPNTSDIAVSYDETDKTDTDKPSDTADTRNPDPKEDAKEPPVEQQNINKLEKSKGKKKVCVIYVNCACGI
jgi:FtsZ-interacting cell division protein ZipA